MRTNISIEPNGPTAHIVRFRECWLTSSIGSRLALALFILAAGHAVGEEAAHGGRIEAAGPLLTLTPPELQFPTVMVGTVGASETITITNNSGTTISGISITASNDFSVGSTCNASLAAGATCQNNVTFVPTATGLRSANLTVSYAGQPAPSLASLSGLAYAVVSIAITPQAAPIPAGAGRQYHALAAFSDGSIQDVSASANWTSSAPATLIVDDSGLATGIATGSALLSANWNGAIGGATVNVTTPTLLSLAVDATQLSLPQGYAQQFNAVGSYSDGTQLVLTDQATWTSSGPLVATVSAAGLASTLSPGSALVTASLGPVSSSASLTVTGATLQSVAVSPAIVSMAASTILQLQATGAYSDGSTHSLTDLASWSSSAPNAMTVSAIGRISSGTEPGEATISATFGGISGTASIAVTPAYLTSITVVPGKPSMPATASGQFTAAGIFSDGSTQDVSLLVHWMSSAGLVATVADTVQSEGLVKALATGDSTITASYLPSVFGLSALTVDTAALVSIAITPANRGVPAGGALQFWAAGTFSDGTVHNLTQSVTWSSANSSTLLVSNDQGSQGFGYGLAAGLDTVTATSGHVTGSTSFSEGTPTLVSIGVTPQSATIAAGDTQQLAATGTYSNGSTQNMNATAVWSSASPAIATVGSGPGPGGLVLGVSQGQVNITAAAAGISGTSQLTVSAPQLVSISITPASPATVIGNTVQFAAIGTYTDGTTQNLDPTWTSLNTDVASISGSGLATALTVGITTIDASLDAINATTALSVAAAALPPPPLCQQAPTGLPPLPASTTQPALPQSCTVPVYPTPSGLPWLANTAEALQAALTNAVCGQSIQVQAGIVYQGAFVVPGLACPVNSPVLVENSAMLATVTCVAGSAPPCSAGTVGQTIPVFPQWTAPPESLAGTAYVPTLESTDSTATLTISDGAANWYFAGLELTLAPSAANVYPIVNAGDITTTVGALPQYITFDRTLVHPAPCLADAVGSECNYVARGFDFDAVNGTVMFSSVWGIVNPGQDTQAIAISNSTGPALIVGNYLEATGENVMFNTSCTEYTPGTGANGMPLGSMGWETGDTGIPTCPVPADITVRLNHFHKQLAWQSLPAGCVPGGTPQCYDVKNLFEIKYGQRVLLDSNIFDTSFMEGQGEAIIMNCFYQGIYVCQDFTITNNVIEHVPMVAPISGNGAPIISPDCGAAGQPACTIQTGQRVLFRNNLAIDVNGNGSAGSFGPGVGYGGLGLSFQSQYDNDVTADHNTILNQPPLYLNGLNFTDQAPSTDTGFQWTNNISYASPFANALSPGQTIAELPSPTLGGDLFVGDYWPNITQWYIAVPVYPTGILTVASTATPVAGQPSCNYENKPIAQCWPLDFALVGFVDLAGGNAGTDLPGMVLAATSPYHNAGTDGTDIGANIPAILAAVSTITW